VNFVQKLVHWDCLRFISASDKDLPLRHGGHRNFNMIKYIKYFLLFFLINIRLFATVNVSDRIIIDKDTLSLFSNPLESFFKENKIYGADIFADSIFNNDGSWSGAVSLNWDSHCWRGFIAIFEIINDNLFLNQIRDCDFEDTLNLKKILKEEIKKNKNFRYYDKHFDGLKWGYKTWINGYDDKNKKYIRTYVASNYNRTVILNFEMKTNKSVRFEIIADIIFNSLMLTGT